MSAQPTALDAPAVAIARQPIHDRARRVVGYELLFRGTGDAGAGMTDDERATTSVIVETFTGVGVEAIAGGRPAHVRVSRRFLLELHAFALPPERVVLEVAAPAPGDAALIAVLERLAAQRYRVSLACDPDAAEPPAPRHVADSVKIDVTGLGSAQIDVLARRLRPTGATLIAAGVDTPALLQQCRAAGFDRFQGFFFCTPDVVRAQALPTAGIAQLRTLAGLYAAETSFEQFEQIIARDVGLSYRLLCYLNSAFFGLRREVASVREALTLLGMRAVRRWATLMALSGADDKPHELIVTALLRGRMCEAIGRATASAPGAVGAQDAYFTVGLLSVMDALLDAPLAQALDPLALAEPSRAALIEHAGSMGAALSAVLSYERGDVERARRHAPGVALGDAYLGAVAWADAASAGIERPTTATSASTTSGAN
jgi:EAL and modified HD-GYP domain-containing signal transduction protein